MVDERTLYIKMVGRQVRRVRKTNCNGLKKELFTTWKNVHTVLKYKKRYKHSIIPIILETNSL